MGLTTSRPGSSATAANSGFAVPASGQAGYDVQVSSQARDRTPTGVEHGLYKHQALRVDVAGAVGLDPAVHGLAHVRLHNPDRHLAVPPLLQLLKEPRPVGYPLAPR